jgi:tetratricopeptide (TPR) repeat protein
MRRALLFLLLGCSSPSPAPPAATPATPCPSAASASPSQNEQLYAKGSELEKEGRWEEAAATYQKYVLAMGDGLTHTDRSSMEVRILALREKVWPKIEGPRKPMKLPDELHVPPGPCTTAYSEARYEQAVACWRDDYLKTKQPADVFFAARAYELNHTLEAAIDLYTRFLEAADVGADESGVRAKIADVRERVAASRSAGPSRP